MAGCTISTPSTNREDPKRSQAVRELLHPPAGPGREGWAGQGGASNPGWAGQTRNARPSGWLLASSPLGSELGYQSCGMSPLNIIS